MECESVLICKKTVKICSNKRKIKIKMAIAWELMFWSKFKKKEKQIYLAELYKLIMKLDLH